MTTTETKVVEIKCKLGTAKIFCQGDGSYFIGTVTLKNACELEELGRELVKIAGEELHKAMRNQYEARYEEGSASA